MKVEFQGDGCQCPCCVAEKAMIAEMLEVVSRHMPALMAAALAKHDGNSDAAAALVIEGVLGAGCSLAYGIGGQFGASGHEFAVTLANIARERLARFAMISRGAAVASGTLQ